MKTQIMTAVLATLLATLSACDKSPEGGSTVTTTTRATAAAPAETAAPAADPAVAPPNDGPKNIVNVAVGSKDHTTLVTALKAADYVDSLTNPGPFTVFAPTNAAFDKLPKGTVEGLIKPEKKADLAEILKYHVAVSIYQQKDLKDGMVLAMANGAKVKFAVKDGKITVNGANIVASVPASNGVIHVIDAVLLPPAK